MRREKSYWPLYAASILAWLACFVAPAFWQMHVRGEHEADKYYATVPTIPPDVLWQELDKVEAAAKAPSDDPEDYHAVLHRLNQLETAAQKGDRGTIFTPNASPDFFEYRRAALRTNALRNALQQAYHEKHTVRVMAETAERYFREHPERRETAATLSPPLAPQADLWLGMYTSALPFALFIFLLRLDANGFSILIELLTLWRLALATLLWPVGIFKYPNGDPARQIIHGLRFATLTLGTLLCGGVAAKAQSSSGSAGGKNDTKRRWSLQTDLRSSGLIAGPADGTAANGFLRATLTSPSKYFLETVSVAKKGFALNSTTIGRPLFTIGPFTTNVVAGGIWDTADGRSLVGGIQVFGGTPHFGLAMPVLSVERSLGPVTRTTLANTAQLVAKSGHLRIGGEYSLRKTDDRPLSWTAGPVVQVTTHGGFIEAALLREQTGDWRLRGRFVHNLHEARGPSEAEFTTTVNTSIRSQYVGVLAMSPHDRPVLQSSVTVSHGPSGLYAGVWHSVSPDGSANNNYGDEVDYYAGITRTVGPFSVDAGYLYFDVLPIGKQRADLYDAYLSVSAPAMRVRPYLRTDWIVGRDPDILEGGLAWRTGIRPAVGPLTVDLSVSGHDGIVGIRPEPTSSGRAVFSATRTIFKKVAATPFLAFQKRFGAVGGIARDRVWAGLDLSYSFAW